MLFPAQCHNKGPHRSRVWVQLRAAIGANTLFYRALRELRSRRDAVEVSASNYRATALKQGETRSACYWCDDQVAHTMSASSMLITSQRTKTARPLCSVHALWLNKDAEELGQPALNPE